MATLSLTGMLRRSLVHRRARSVSALVAMTVSAGVATALLTLYADLDAKLHKEFRSFGANVVITAGANAPLPADALARVQQAAGCGCAGGGVCLCCGDYGYGDTGGRGGDGFCGGEAAGFVVAGGCVA